MGMLALKAASTPSVSVASAPLSNVHAVRAAAWLSVGIGDGHVAPPLPLAPPTPAAPPLPLAPASPPLPEPPPLPAASSLDEQPSPVAGGEYGVILVINRTALMSDRSGVFFVEIGQKLPDGSTVTAVEETPGGGEVRTSYDRVYGPRG